MVQIYIQGLGYVDVSKNTGDKYLMNWKSYFTH